VTLHTQEERRIMAKGSRKSTSGRARARRQAQARRPESAGKVNAVRMIAASALKSAVKDINSILEHNSEQAGAIGEIKRAAQEKGMDGVALGLLVRLYRKGQNNPVKLRQILDSFDYGRDVLKLDELKAADMLLDEAVGKRRSREEAAEIDPRSLPRQIETFEVDAATEAKIVEAGETLADNVHRIWQKEAEAS
jgi:hypothetical protein